jgi:hypothetical protein
MALDASSGTTPPWCVLVDLQQHLTVLYRYVKRQQQSSQELSIARIKTSEFCIKGTNFNYIYRPILFFYFYGAAKIKEFLSKAPLFLGQNNIYRKIII